MTDADHADGLRAAEHRLQAAQLAGDVAELDRLLDDRLVFTFGPEPWPPFCSCTERTPEPGRTRPQTATPDPRFFTTIGKR